jgi:hypothetical protein
VLAKIAGNQDSGGFRDMYTLSVSGSSSSLLPPSVPEEQAFPSRNCVLQLDVYERDRTTIAWTATTDPDDPVTTQILMEPSQYGEQEVDPVQGKASITQVNVAAVDYPGTPGDQDSGIMTARIAGSTGLPEIDGRRGQLRRFIDPVTGWITINDGDCGPPRLSDTFAAITFEIRDSRDRERQTKAFQRGSTTSLFPRGVIGPLGNPFALGSQITNVESLPLTGRASYEYYYDTTTSPPAIIFANVKIDFTQHIAGYPGGPYSVSSERHVLMPDAEAAGEGRLIPHPQGWKDVEYPTVVVWWRPLGGSAADWVKVKPTYLEPAVGAIVYIPPVWGNEIYDGTFNGIEMRVPAFMHMAKWSPGTSTPNLPTDGQQIDFLIQYNGPPTESMPFHWSGTLGDFLTDAYDGEFSPKAPSIVPPDPVLYDEGTAISTGVRYDAAALALLTQEVNARITEPVDNLRSWLEDEGYAPSGYFPAFDRDLNISPLSHELPNAAVRAALVDINNDISVAVPGWSGGDKKINLIKYLYPRYFQNPVDANGFPVGNVDGLVEQEVEVWYVAANGNLSTAVSGPQFLASVSDSIDQFGERVQSFSTRLFGAAQAIGIPFDYTQEQGYQLAAEIADSLLPRYSFGAPLAVVPVRRSATSLLRPGNWTKVNLSWMPEYRTQRRGLSRYAQILGIRDLNCAWRELTLEMDAPIGSVGDEVAVGFAAGGPMTVVAKARTIGGGGFAGGSMSVESSRTAGGTAGGGLALVGSRGSVGHSGRAGIGLVVVSGSAGHAASAGAAVGVVVVSGSAIATATGGGGGFFDAVLDLSPAVFWKLDETSGTEAADATGNGRHGQYDNSPTLDEDSLIPTEPTSGSVGLDGIDQQIAIADAVWQTSVDEFTVLLVYYPRSFAAQRDIVGKELAWQVWQETDGDITFYINSGGWQDLRSTTPLSIDTPHLVVLRKQGGTTDLRSIWINGVKDAESALDGNVNDGGAMWVGQSGNNRHINAIVQAFAFWPTTALTDEEIEGLYDSYTG